MLNKTVNKPRQANFEIMRVVLMMLIVVCHFIVHGFLFNAGEPVSVSVSEVNFIEIFNYLTLNLFLIISAVAVNCFVLIGGYFMINSSSKLEKIIRLFIQVLFYSVSLSVVFVLLGKTLPDYLLNAITPIRSNIYWFFTNYIAMLLLAPFLSEFAGKICKRRFQTLLLILFLLNVNFLFDLPYGSLFSNNGYSLFWFVFLFFVGGYIRLYGLHFENRINRFYVFILLAVLFLMFFVVKSFVFNRDKFLYFNNYVPYNGFTFFLSLVFFLWMKNMSVNINNNIVKIFLGISPYVFAVYLIHDHPLVRNFLWHELIIPAQYMNFWYLIPLMFFICFSVFIICIFVDIIRDRLFILFKVEHLVDFLCLWIRRFIGYIKMYL